MKKPRSPARIELSYIDQDGKREILFVWAPSKFPLEIPRSVLDSFERETNKCMMRLDPAPNKR